MLLLISLIVIFPPGYLSLSSKPTPKLKKIEIFLESNFI